MTPDLLNALADLVMSIHSAPASKGDALCVALGLDADATRDEMGAALRALARPDMGKVDCDTSAAPIATTTSTLLNRLADIVSRLRHMWDDTDGDTHMPVEESDDISAVGTDIAADLACPDQWMDIAGAIRSHAASIDHAARVESETDAALVAAVTAAHAGDLGAASDAATCALALLGLDSAFRVRVEKTTLTPGLPAGWEWVEGSTTEAQSAAGDYGVHVVGGTVYIDGEAPVEAVLAVLARAGVTS